MNIKTLLFILFFSGTQVFAQHGRVAGVAVACEKLRLAMIDPVAADLSALVTDSLSYGHSGGHVDSKEDFLEKLLSGKSDFVSMEITKQRVQVYKRTAIVRHHLSAITNDNGKPGSVSLEVLLVWVKSTKGWLLAARQAVKTG